MAAAPANGWKYKFRQLTVQEHGLTRESKTIGSGTVGAVFRGSVSLTPNAPPVPIAFKMLNPNALSQIAVIAHGDEDDDAPPVPDLHFLLHEARLAWKATLQGHRNLITFYGACSEPAGLAFELANMGTLDQMLHVHTRDAYSGKTSHTPRDPSHPKYLRRSEALPCVDDIIVGLSFLHYIGIVHADLKTPNVLVHDESDDTQRNVANGQQTAAVAAAPAIAAASASASGVSTHPATTGVGGASAPASGSSSGSSSSNNSATPRKLCFKLGDFGSARAFKVSVMTRLSSVQSVIANPLRTNGTVQYAAPESLKSSTPDVFKDPRIDIYSLGVVIGEIFVRTLPFPTMSTDDVRDEKRRRCAPTPAQLSSEDPEVRRQAEKAAKLAEEEFLPFDAELLERESPLLAELVRGCCAVNPDRRWTMDLVRQRWKILRQALEKSGYENAPAARQVQLVTHLPSAIPKDAHVVRRHILFLSGLPSHIRTVTNPAEPLQQFLTTFLSARFGQPQAIFMRAERMRTEVGKINSTQAFVHFPPGTDVTAAIRAIHGSWIPTSDQFKYRLITANFGVQRVCIKSHAGLRPSACNVFLHPEDYSFDASHADGPRFTHVSGEKKLVIDQRNYATGDNYLELLLSFGYGARTVSCWDILNHGLPHAKVGLLRDVEAMDRGIMPLYIFQKK